VLRNQVSLRIRRFIMTAVGEAVQVRLAASFVRPRGDVTALSIIAPELDCSSKLRRRS